MKCPALTGWIATDPGKKPKTCGSPVATAGQSSTAVRPSELARRRTLAGLRHGFSPDPRPARPPVSPPPKVPAPRFPGALAVG